MAAISIRDLGDDVRDRLRRRAAEHGRSMEAEARAILTEAVTPPRERPDLFATLLERVGGLGGVEMEAPSRHLPPRAADLHP